MSKYEELKEQVLEETSWAIDSINENHAYGPQIPEKIDLVEFISGKYDFLTQYERGMLFAYLSMKSKVDSMEEES